MIFQNDNHKRFFEGCVKKTHAEHDPERQALFYTLGLTEETRKNINSIYDFDENMIMTEGVFQKAWQTSTSVATTRLAYNLYNGFNGWDGEYDDPGQYTPCTLFCNRLAPYYMEAMKIRFPDYCRDMDKMARIRESMAAKKGIEIKR